ncbi:phosphotransferase family protein [Peribacillus sp. B-H-3]|uniref:phosphotransferase family protein n=1 Tax=Peribacillus sp. B-H-3 TaxID=3400420 RepID=UPI003B014E9A
MLPIRMDEIPVEIKEYLNKINSISYPRQGYTSDVGLINSDQGFFVLKRTKGKVFCSILKKERFILNILTNKTELPIPKVKKFLEVENDTVSWILMDFLEGETLRSSALLNEKKKENRHEIIFNFGRILSQIHSTPCPDELINEHRWLNLMLYKAEKNSKIHEVDGTKELLKSIKENQPKDYNQTLIHGDFTIDNVLVSHGVITGVIDWGYGAFGDPRFDVSLAIRPKRNAFENEIDKQIFFEGYGGKIITDNDYDYFANGLYEFF